MKNNFDPKIYIICIDDFFNDYNVEKLIDRSLTRYKQKMTLIDLNSNFQF
jgi:hypothetical protein